MPQQFVPLQKDCIASKSTPKQGRGRPRGHRKLSPVEERVANGEAEEIFRRCTCESLNGDWQRGEWVAKDLGLAEMLGVSDRVIRKYRTRHLRKDGDTLYLDKVERLVRDREANAREAMCGKLSTRLDSADAVDEEARREVAVALGRLFDGRPISWRDGSVHESVKQLLGHLRMAEPVAEPVGEPEGEPVIAEEEDWPTNETV